jgi:hypothetical protein
VQIRVTGFRAGDVDKRLHIEVVDDGCGIQAEDIDKVFEPFFTTKGPGRGSGLGLSMVRAYADQFGGTATVVSQPDSGTCIRLSFPSSAGAIEDSAAMTMPLASLPMGTERLVLMVAEDHLSAMMEQILTVLGYRCEIAADLESAISLLSTMAPELLISDGFDIGPLLDARLGAKDVNRRVLMLRSMGESDVSENGPVLYKPFSLPDLAKAVREALDAD